MLARATNGWNVNRVPMSPRSHALTLSQAARARAHLNESCPSAAGTRADLDNGGNFVHYTLTPRILSSGQRVRARTRTRTTVITDD